MNDPLDTLFRNALGLHRYVDNNVDRGNAGFPPFNILVDNKINPSKFTIELAVAGFSREQLSVKLRKDTGINILIIEGNRGVEDEESDDRLYTIHGLSAKSFVRKFTLANNVTVTDITLVNGILTVQLEAVKPKDIEQLLTIR